MTSLFVHQPIAVSQISLTIKMYHSTRTLFLVEIFCGDVSTGFEIRIHLNGCDVIMWSHRKLRKIDCNLAHGYR